jgi:membrane associated rhomboid family serine protease
MDQEKKRFIDSIVFPSIFLLLIWIVKIIEVVFDVPLSNFGIQPLNPIGLLGIITAPLLHEGFQHLAANSIPVLVLGIAIFYFYREIAWKIILLIYFTTGLWTWFIAREGNHIGASGLIYGMAAFLIFSGLIRRDVRLSIISFLVIFFYGSLVWGVFPDFFPDKNISWESHLMGFISGVILAFYFRKYGPQRKKYDWEDEEEDETDDNDNGPSNPDDQSGGKDDENLTITYHYKPS